MREYTVKERKEIIKNHLKSHGGVLDVNVFVEEARDPNHPAHDWSGWKGWNESSLAEAWLKQAARLFIAVRGECQTHNQERP